MLTKEQIQAARKVAEKMQWRLIEEAPHNENVLLGWWSGDQWETEVALASWGWRNDTKLSVHGSATHWMPLPEPPN
jgi:hypothetical protein